MTSMVEKAARALEEKVVKGYTTYEEAARAVIEAIREPTKAMVIAGNEKAQDCIDSDWDSGLDGESYNSYEHLRSDAPAQIFRAMIDAALNEKEQA